MNTSSGGKVAVGVHQPEKRREEEECRAYYRTACNPAPLPAPDRLGSYEPKEKKKKPRFGNRSCGNLDLLQGAVNDFLLRAYSVAQGEVLAADFYGFGVEDGGRDVC